MSALGNPVEVGKIDGALRELWDTNEVATKASLINFAIYSECDDCLETNSDLISEITTEHACRAIIIAASPGTTGRSVNSWITAHCHLGDGGRKSVCSEQVAFQIGGATADLIRNIVFAHLESDLPLVFWWQGDFTDVFEDRLYSRINRLIVDSACWSDPAAQIDRLSAARSDRASHFVLYDLNWARLLNFRLAVAGLFDDATALASLPSLEKITLTHGPEGSLTALFLVAWINSRLDHEIPHELVEIDTPHHLACVEFTPSTGGSLSVCHCEREDTLLKANIDLPGHRGEHLHPAAPSTLPALITQQLQSGGANTTYFKLLKSLKSLLPLQKP